MWKKAGGVLLCGALAISLAACGGSDGSDSDGAIKIGVISPQTGPSSDPGLRVKEGATVAEEVINANGGVNGRKIQLEFADDASTPENGVLKLKEMSSNGVKYFTGTVNSTVAIALSNFLLNSNDLYVLTAAQSQDPLDQQKNGNIFAMSNTNVQYGAKYFPWIQSELKPTKIAVLAETSDYGNNEIASLQAALKGDGAPQIVVERFDREQSDYSVQLTKLISQHPDALYAAAGGTDLPAKIIKQARELGFQGQALSSPGTIAQAFIDAGGSAVEGAVSANVYAPSLDNATNKEFVQRFEAKYNRLPSAEAALGYDSVWSIVQAMEKAGNPDDPKAVAAAYKSGEWDTTRGPRKFDDTGRMINDTYIVKVDNGKIVAVP